jgi:uncharacterized protein DUF4019
MRLLSSVLALGLALAAAAALGQTKPSPRFSEPSLLPAVPALVPGPQRPAAAAPKSEHADLEKAGQTAAHAWLVLLDRKDWGTAWDASSQVFRQSVPLPAWMDNIPKLRDPFGAFVEREPVEAAYRKTLPGRPEGDYVTVVFTSRFAGKEQVQETVTTVREPDGRWRVTGYTAR